MVNVANAIELGQIQAGLVVACESAREIVDLTIERLNREKSMGVLRKTVATLTGGSGAVAVLLTDSASSDRGHRILGGVARSAPEHHRLCVWGPTPGSPAARGTWRNRRASGAAERCGARHRHLPGFPQSPRTAGQSARQDHLPPGRRDPPAYDPGCHRHPGRPDFTTFRFLGNVGTVSLPVTAAIAHERGFWFRRHGRVPRHRQRAELPDAGNRVVKEI